MQHEPQIGSKWRRNGETHNCIVVYVRFNRVKGYDEVYLRDDHPTQTGLRRIIPLNNWPGAYKEVEDDKDS